MKIQVLDIQIGDRIIAYCNNKRQACTVRQILVPEKGSIALTVWGASQFGKKLEN